MEYYRDRMYGLPPPLKESTAVAPDQPCRGDSRLRLPSPGGPEQGKDEDTVSGFSGFDADPVQTEAEGQDNSPKIDSEWVNSDHSGMDYFTDTVTSDSGEEEVGALDAPTVKETREDKLRALAKAAPEDSCPRRDDRRRLWARPFRGWGGTSETPPVDKSLARERTRHRRRRHNRRAERERRQLPPAAAGDLRHVLDARRAP